MNTFVEIYNLMSTELTPFEGDFSFEDFKNENGICYWWASDLMRMLGYKDSKSFDKAIGRAIKACITLSIPQEDNFIHATRDINGEQVKDCKLTRFACYMVVMNADSKKEPVAAAQVYFAEQTRKFELFIQNSEQFERILIRDEIKEGQKSLMGIATKAGVQDYARFHNAGFSGLYNMLNVELAQKRNIEPAKLYDHMGRTELAANLFRITQTEERIKNFSIRGQRNLESTHYGVGKEVREIILKNTGKPPEQLPMEKKLPELQKELKKGYKNMIKQDKKK
jgi:DNA-damage-inducible protein D